MDKMCNRVCEIIAGYENNGTLQSETLEKIKAFKQRWVSLSVKIGKNGNDNKRKNF